MSTDALTCTQKKCSLMKPYVHRNHALAAACTVLLVIVLALLTGSEPAHRYRFDRQTLKLHHVAKHCTITATHWIVITSINYPTAAVQNFASLRGWTTVIVADEKTPKDWVERLRADWNSTTPPNVVFLSVEQQMKLGYQILDIVPFKSYARKNIGYLYAIGCGAQVLYETDDDNDLTEGMQLDYLTQSKRPAQVSVGDAYSHTVNPYALFGRPDIWPRGFPLKAITNFTHEFRKVQQTSDNRWQARPLVQQGLADLDPDVDAIWRLTQPGQIGTVHFNAQPRALAIKSGFFTPYNSQNTLHLSEAFWGLLVPYSTSIRVCDIWRSYWVQRLLWDIDGQLAFRPPNVEQIRNAHDYLIDFKDELQLYEQADDLVHFLYSWESSHTDLFGRILQLAEDMANHKFWSEEEVLLIKAWLADLTELGYKPPPINPKFDAHPVENVQEGIVKEFAVCITGQADRSAAAIPATIDMLKAAWKKGGTTEADVFSYISTYDSCPDDIKWVSHQDYNYSILYSDKKLTLPHPTDDSRFLLRPGFTVNGWLQQHYGLQRCMELVQEFEVQHHVTYRNLIRIRTDHVLSGNISALVESFADTAMSIHIPIGSDFAGINDRIAWGPLSLMQTYMSRFDRMHKLSEDEYSGTNFHAESYLRDTLVEAGVSVSRVDVGYDELPKQEC